MKQESAPSRVCLMCGEMAKKFTGEHVFPKWLRTYFPIDQKRKLKNRYYPDTIGRDPGTKQIRQVCSNCNNNWMSVLQNKVRPIFERLHKGVAYREDPRIFSFSQVEASEITLWAIMTTMVIELLDERSNSITPYERAIFSKNLSFNKNWRVWFSQSCAGAERGFTHRQQILPQNVRKFGIPEILAGPPIDWQATTFIAGRGVFLTTSGILIPPSVEKMIEETGFVRVSQSNHKVVIGRCVYTDRFLLDLNKQIMDIVASFYNDGQPPVMHEQVWKGTITPVR